MNKDRKLLVIGASSDIGGAIIRRVKDNYDTVIAHYNHWNEQLEELKSQNDSNIVFVQADLSDEQSTSNMIDYIVSRDLQPDHIIHLSASRNTITQKFAKTTWDKYQIGWEISVHSIYSILHSFVPYMSKKKYGKVIFMLSAYTFDTPPKYQCAYNTVKYALMGMMKSLAVEYADKGITFNGVSPDMMDTKFISDLPELMINQYAQTRPSKQILCVEDVVPTFEYLLSDGTDKINGVNIRI